MKWPKIISLSFEQWVKEFRDLIGSLYTVQMLISHEVIIFDVKCARLVLQNGKIWNNRFRLIRLTFLILAFSNDFFFLHLAYPPPPPPHFFSGASLSVFELPVGLYEWKVKTAHPMLTIMFKNILRGFEAEIFKIFKNIRLQSKN